MTSLKVLITNDALSGQSGTEMYVYDLARQLLRGGHRPQIYSPALGPLAEQLSAATIPVVNDLALIPQQPDIIHGHHSLPTLQALLHFPHTPAIYVCHDWNWVHDTPPKLPRIGRYVAVDETVRDRLITREAIAASQVDVIYNGVDLDRFQPRTALPPRPRKALAISNYLTPDQAAIISTACAKHGITLDAAGRNLGGVCARPEDVFGNYDLVFAKARCAWEALAVGAAVIVCDTWGLGPLVTTERLPFLRRFNFGRRLLQHPLTADVLAREIEAYDSADAAEVSQQIRATAGLGDMTTRLLECYAMVISEHHQRPPDLAADMRATAAFLQNWPARFHDFNGKTNEESPGTNPEQLRSVVRQELQRERRATGLRKWIHSLQKRLSPPAASPR